MTLQRVVRINAFEVVDEEEKPVVVTLFIDLNHNVTNAVVEDK